MALTLLTDRSEIAEPLTVAEAALFCYVDGHEQDALLGRWVRAAREWVENYTRRQLITAEWLLTLDRFPKVERTNPHAAIMLPLGCLQTIEAFAYLDEAGTEQTLVEGTDFVSEAIDDAITDGCRLAPPYEQAWPATRSQIAAVRIDFTCGYGDTAAAVPETIKTAMCKLVKSWYENREASIALPLRQSIEEELSGFVLHDLV